MKSSFTKMVLIVVGGVLCVVGLLVAGAFLAGTSALQAILTTNPFGTKSETVNTQVTHAIARSEEVVLLSLGVQGIEKSTDTGTFWGMTVPGSERASFLQYSFNAKLGIDGKDVEIQQSGEREFAILVPRFTFIGNDDVRFEVPIENNGVLSWVTPEIDTVAMTNKVLSVDARQKYVDSNDEILREQAVAFYSRIIAAIDPTIQLDFQFESHP